MNINNTFFAYRAKYLSFRIFTKTINMNIMSTPHLSKIMNIYVLYYVDVNISSKQIGHSLNNV